MPTEVREVRIEGAESLDEQIAVLQQTLHETLAHAVAIERALARLTSKRLTEAAIKESNAQLE